MVTKLKPTEAVLVGVGMTGCMIAKELTDAGVKVVGLERGEDQHTVPDFQTPHIHDELRYQVRMALMQDLRRETLTFRNNAKQVALPMRQLGSFLPGTGVGGSIVHWNGQSWRFLPYDFKIRTATAERYGKNKIPSDMSIQDWPVSYADLEPYYGHFEWVWGISGQAAHVNDQKYEGGNPFEGARTRGYPNPPMKTSYAGSIFAKAAESIGLHPFPCPSGNMSRPYTNPYGLKLGACVYCGYCEKFACEMGAKSTPQTVVLPLLRKSPHFELRIRTNVIRIHLDSSGKRATGVTYVDAQGQEFFQPAEMVFLTSYVFNNVKLMLVSHIGEPYDPKSGHGVVGKNYCYQMTSSVTGFFDDKHFNSFMGAGALGQIVDDYNGDNFDHSNHDFIHGAYIHAYTVGARPIDMHPIPSDAPKWGTGWKKAVAQYFDRNVSVGTHGAVMSYRHNHLDLDPTYRDEYGQPLLRMTFDFGANEHNMSRFVTDRAADIVRAMRPSKMNVSYRKGHYSIVPYQTTHNTGGCMMGDSPHNSVVNRYSQNWDVHNLFVFGASSFPQNAGYNPSETIGALTYYGADAIVKRYLKRPGLLV